MQIAVNILISASLIFLIARSFSIIFFPAKFFHIAHAITITLGAYFLHFFFQHLQLPHFAAIPLSIVITAFIGYIFERFIFRILRNRNVSSLILLITSLGLYIIIQNIVSLIWGDATLTIRTSDIQLANTFRGIYITRIQLITVLLSIAVYILTEVFMNRTSVGQKTRAISANEELSEIYGIDTNKIIAISFLIGSAVAGLAGILIAFDYDMKPTMGFNYLIYGVVAMIIGGVGSNWGLIAGSFLIATAQHLAAYFIGSEWMDAISYIILILFLIWKPLGFSGKQLKKVEI